MCSAVLSVFVSLKLKFDADKGGKASAVGEEQ